MDEITLGMMPSFLNAIWDPWAPWPKVSCEEDARVQPPCDDTEDLEAILFGGGRRMRHPFLGELVYPRKPDVTLNVGYDIMPRAVSQAVKTADSTASVTFLDRKEDVVVRELWKAGANQLSTWTEFFHALHGFWTTPMPPGNFVGWYGPDLMPQPYHIKILSVTLGRPDSFTVEELGPKLPWVMRESLAVAFKVIREVVSPSGAMAAEGL
ncbi:MAG: hypothetical protein LN413_00325 [Candidatus Thermoplasmatota archaeon]|nr:hypothetical protein [Candidatus Thermoplasmatota archaeon]